MSSGATPAARVALLSDVHANLPALEAVLADIDSRMVSCVYHLGDLVGYGPWPDECVALLHERGIAGVAGNYDTTVGHGAEHCGCRSESEAQEVLAQASFMWTLANTGDATRRALRALPFRMDVRPLGGHRAGPTLRLLHGNHTLNTVYTTSDRTDEQLSAMGGALGARPGDVVAFGHTHKPWLREVDEVAYVNTGSVGRPKDGDARAGYVLVTLPGGARPVVEHVRIAYDVERAAAAVVARGLPAHMADFLRAGGAAP